MTRAGSPALSHELRQGLLTLLDGFAPEGERDARQAASIREFVCRHADPFDRHLAEGHLTGSAFVLDPAGRILLTHHRRLNLWLQLGGHAEEERRASEVALREAREESGLPDLRFHEALTMGDGAPRLLDLDIHDIPARPGEPAHAHLDLRFLLRTEQPERARCDPGESRALEWVTARTCGQRGDESMRRALRRIEDLNLTS